MTEMMITEDLLREACELIGMRDDDIIRLTKELFGTNKYRSSSTSVAIQQAAVYEDDEDKSA